MSLYSQQKFNEDKYESAREKIVWPWWSIFFGTELKRSLKVSELSETELRPAKSWGDALMFINLQDKEIQKLKEKDGKMNEVLLEKLKNREQLIIQQTKELSKWKGLCGEMLGYLKNERLTHRNCDRESTCVLSEVIAKVEKELKGE